jgi:hypothetical protein
MESFANTEGRHRLERSWYLHGHVRRGVALHPTNPFTCASWYPRVASTGMRESFDDE